MRWLVLLVCLLPLTAWAADSRDAARAEQLDRLFKALKAAPDEPTAGMIEQRIRGLWLQQASPAATLLMTRGDRDLNNDAGGEAIADFDAVLDLEPNFAEGYNYRAVARAEVGDYAGAVRDIKAALSHDPRNFAALQGLSRLAEQQGNWQGALDAWRKSLDIDPRTPGGLDRLEMLQKKVDGEST